MVDETLTLIRVRLGLIAAETWWAQPEGSSFLFQGQPRLSTNLLKRREIRGKTNTYANGREALDYLNESRAPCLVLLDLEMPVMNGWEFRANQLMDERLSRIPVVVVTADGGLGKRLPGVEGFLLKPMKFEKLVTVLDGLCSRKTKGPPATTLAEA